jgi:hypothetical protein
VLALFGGLGATVFVVVFVVVTMGRHAMVVLGVLVIVVRVDVEPRRLSDEAQEREAERNGDQTAHRASLPQSL